MPSSGTPASKPAAVQTKSASTAAAAAATQRVRSAGKEGAIDLKSRWIAGVLAFLLPGAGHLYQGRLFKAALYAGCILSTFAFGVSIGEGRPVYLYYYNTDNPNFQEHFLDHPADLLESHAGVGKVAGGAEAPRNFNYGYLCQVMAGLPSLPGYFQTARYLDSSNRSTSELERGFRAKFKGFLVGVSALEDGEQLFLADGDVTLKMSGDIVPVVKGQFNGVLRGQDDREEPVSLELGNTPQPRDLDNRFSQAVQVGPPIFADPKRTIVAPVSDAEKLKLTSARLEGTTNRSIWNWYAVPLEDATLQKLNLQLGKHWELAMVFTWIAGLLNVLAIWDAIEGPAYGRGDEPDNVDEPLTPTEHSATSAASVTAPVTATA